MGMGFAPTWLRQMSPLLDHKTTNHCRCDLEALSSLVIGQTIAHPNGRSSSAPTFSASTLQFCQHYFTYDDQFPRVMPQKRVLGRVQPRHCVLHSASRGLSATEFLVIMPRPIDWCIMHWWPLSVCLSVRPSHAWHKSWREGRGQLEISRKEVHDTRDPWPHLKVKGQRWRL